MKKAWKIFGSPRAESAASAPKKVDTSRYGLHTGVQHVEISMLLYKQVDYRFL